MMGEFEQTSLWQWRWSLATFLIVSLLWTSLSTWVGWHAVGLGFPDGFQCVGATFGNRPGHLSWLMVGSFEGYDRTWGYHWFGWPMLRSLAGAMVPWTALGDGILLHLLRSLAAFLVGCCLLSKQRSAGAAMIGFLTVLLNRGWFCSMAFLHRPETLTALFLWLAALPLIGGAGQRSRISEALSVMSLVLLPLMHPLAWPASMLLAAFGSLSVRESSGTTHWMRQSCLRWWLPPLIGAGLFAAYYGSDPFRLDQFKQTLQTASYFKSGLAATAQRLFLDPKNVFFSGPALVVLGLSWPALRCRSGASGDFLRDGLVLSLAMVLLSMLYLLAAGHPNTGHATVMAPFLGYAAGRLHDLDWRPSIHRWFSRSALLGQAAICSLPLLLTSFSFLVKPPESPRARAAAVLDQALASTSGRVIIPLSLWEAAGAASVQDQKRIRFVTFPNWVKIGRRRAYENSVVDSLMEGDVLVTEKTSYESSDPLDLLPWPRLGVLRGEAGWRRLEDFKPVVNTTLSLGGLHRDEMLLGPMSLLRYEAAN